jgi:hypothetical protein
MIVMDLLSIGPLMRSFKKMYKFIKNHNTREIDSIQRLSDMACIPMNEGNSDYVEYLKWVKNGNKTIEADALPIVDVPEPTSKVVSAPFWKVKVILNNKKVLDKVQTFVDTSDDVVLKIFWDKADVVERDSPTFAKITNYLKMKTVVVDKLFDDADNLKV